MAGRPRRIFQGGEIYGDRPDWQPLIDLAPDEVPDFMWMFRVGLEDGATIEAYKHSLTRRYLHLDASGHAYVSLGNGRYGEIDRQVLLQEALADDRPNIV
jgi:hypothetical protein